MFRMWYIRLFLLNWFSPWISWFYTLACIFWFEALLQFDNIFVANFELHFLEVIVDMHVGVEDIIAAFHNVGKFDLADD